MIVRTGNTSLEFITHPDHAHLSRRVMERCVALRAHPRAASILLAVGEHDNGWTETDAAPLIDTHTGRPLDFVSAPLHLRHDVWPRAIARLAHDPWAAALVANHAITVYDRYRSDPAWGTFFAHLETLRADRLRASGGRMADLLDDYRFVRLGDLISLMFCTGWSEPQRFAEWTVSRAGTDVTVTSYPFDRDPIPMEIAARIMPPGPYQSDAELREKLRQAEVVVVRGKLIR